MLPGPCVSAVPHRASPAPHQCPPGPTVARNRLSDTRVCAARVPPPATVTRQRHRPGASAGRLSHFPPCLGPPLSPPLRPTRRSTPRPPLHCVPAATPFKRVPPPSPPAVRPSLCPTLPRTTPMHPRALPSSCRPSETVWSVATASPSADSTAAPPSPPSPMRIAASTHPSTFLPFSSPLNCPSLSPAYRSTPESSPPLRVTIRRQNTTASATPRHPTDDRHPR
jgi:hypothetical protein